MEELLIKGKKAKEASFKLAVLSTADKNAALLKIADSIEKCSSYILEENALDIKEAKNNGIKNSLIDRLLLTEDRISQIADGIRKIAALDDPIGEVISSANRPNGYESSYLNSPNKL